VKSAYVHRKMNHYHNTKPVMCVAYLLLEACAWQLQYEFFKFEAFTFDMSYIRLIVHLAPRCGFCMPADLRPLPRCSHLLGRVFSSSLYFKRGYARYICLRSLTRINAGLQCSGRMSLLRDVIRPPLGRTEYTCALWPKAFKGGIYTTRGRLEH
jgi:hypothetical protein